MTALPGAWRRNITDIHGPAGAAWLERLPELVAACERRWSLRALPPFPDLSYNYVAPAERADGAAVVLKLGVPHPELDRELEALRGFDGHGMVRLLGYDGGWGALVLERLRPGTPLSQGRDPERAMCVAVGIMRQLWRPAPEGTSMATVVGWGRGLGRLRERYAGSCGPLPAALVERAEAAFRDLPGAAGPPVMVHGDLHAGNILSAERDPWLAIDPKGVVGDALYDAANFLNDLLLWVDEPPIERWAAQLAERLGCGRRLLLEWALAQSVLSGWWSLEDHGAGWEAALERAARLAAVLDRGGW